MHQTSTDGVEEYAPLSGKADSLRIVEKIEFWLY